LNITDEKHRQWFCHLFANGRFVFYIHASMCLYAIETMGNEEQQRMFLPLARSYRMVTAYTQTELGHGTDLRRLETEAVFDRASDSFVLNTPTLTATKFWPGAVARTANYVLLMAQLYAPDHDHPCGIQMFLVQIRDMNTHELLPGEALHCS
jgi:acyl-CoA oxidase